MIATPMPLPFTAPSDCDRARPRRLRAGHRRRQRHVRAHHRVARQRLDFAVLRQRLELLLRHAEHRARRQELLDRAGRDASPADPRDSTEPVTMTSTGAPELELRCAVEIRRQPRAAAGPRPPMRRTASSSVTADERGPDTRHITGDSSVVRVQCGRFQVSHTVSPGFVR